MNDIPRDTDLGRELRALEGDASLAQADWDRLRAAIASRSAFTLANLRRGGAWWEFTARWGRIAAPVAAAAAIILALILPISFGSTGAGGSDRAGLPMIVTGEAPESDLVQTAAAEGGPDEVWLEDTVLGDR